MSTHDPSNHQDRPQGRFLTSRVGLGLLGFLAVAGVLLVYEHRAHIFVGNWFLIALLVLCMGLHHFMHGGHGGHGGHGTHRDHDASDDRDRKADGGRS